jgi:starvation-inducible DNA-binding protein
VAEEDHERILVHAHDDADRVMDQGIDGSSDLLVSDVIRIGGLQAWLLAGHLVDTPLTRANNPAAVG